MAFSQSSLVDYVSRICPQLRNRIPRLSNISFRANFCHRFERNTRIVATNTRCSFCNMIGHTISDCCHEVSLVYIVTMCEDIEFNYNHAVSVVSYPRFNLREALNVYFNQKPVKILKLFAGFIGCSSNHTKARLIISIMSLLMVAILPSSVANINPPPTATNTPPPPPPPINTNPSDNPPVQLVRPATSSPLPRMAHPSSSTTTTNYRIPLHVQLRFPPPPSEEVIMIVEEDEDENTDCPICYEPFDKKYTVTTQCNHKFCVDCTTRHFCNEYTPCPMCREAVTDITVASYECYYSIVSKYLD